MQKGDEQKEIHRKAERNTKTNKEKHTSLT